MTRILVAEPNDTMRLGIRSVLNQSCAYMAIDEVSSTSELLIRLRAQDYELVIVEPMLCGETGPTLVQQLRGIAPASNVLIFTALDEMIYGMRTIRSGAKGYLMKNCCVEEFVTAVHRVGQGKVHMSAALAEKFAFALGKVEATTLYASLSDRERQTLSMLVCGKTVSEIAKCLQLSIKTVSTHKARGMSKLQVSSLTELVQYAISQGLMEECHTRCDAASSRYFDL